MSKTKFWPDDLHTDTARGMRDILGEVKQELEEITGGKLTLAVRTAADSAVKWDEPIGPNESPVEFVHTCSLYSRSNGVLLPFLKLASYCPRLEAGTGYDQPAPCGLEVDGCFPLSGGAAFRDDEFGMARSKPGLLDFGQPPEPTDFVLVRPNEDVFSRRRASGMDPSVFDPVMDLLRDDAQFPRQVGNPPLVLLKQGVVKILSDQAQLPHQPPHPPFRKAAAALGWNEAFGVELFGDGPAVQSLPM